MHPGVDLKGTRTGAVIHFTNLCVSHQQFHHRQRLGQGGGGTESGHQGGGQQRQSLMGGGVQRVMIMCPPGLMASWVDGRLMVRVILSDVASAGKTGKSGWNPVQRPVPDQSGISLLRQGFGPFGWRPALAWVSLQQACGRADHLAGGLVEPGPVPEAPAGRVLRTGLATLAACGLDAHRRAVHLVLPDLGVI